MLDTDTKFILFCHHKAMLDGVEDMLNKEKVNHIRIDGNTPAKIRQEACEIFQTKPNFKIALLSLMACYAGLNLTAATVVVFAEAYWNPGVLTQVLQLTFYFILCKRVNVILLYRPKTEHIELVKNLE